MVARDALLLQAFLGSAVSARAAPGSVLCAEHPADNPDHGPIRIHLHDRCTLVQASALALPILASAAPGSPYAPAVRLSWRPEAEFPRTGPPPGAGTARGPLDDLLPDRSGANPPSMSIVVSGSTPGYGAGAALRASRKAVYRAVWHWLFYTGLPGLPFLVMLSATGSLYLVKDEIDGSLFAYRTRVPARATPLLEPDRLIFNAMQAAPDAVPVSYTDPAASETPALVTLASEDHRILVYLNPYTATCSTVWPATEDSWWSCAGSTASPISVRSRTG